MTFKKSSVVMLPTNQRAQVGMINLEQFNRDGNKLELIHYVITGDGLSPQHLYLTSDEKIKVGDWVYNAVDKKIVQILEDIRCVCKTDKKIIATTDKLPTEPYQGHFEGIDCTNYLPQPSQAFIEKFVSEYNKGNVIKEVLVEYENKTSFELMEGRTWGDKESQRIDGTRPFYVKDLGYFLKISKDNTITIKKVKDSFSWKEAELMLSAFICEHCPEYSSKGNAGMFINKWSEQNL